MIVGNNVQRLYKVKKGVNTMKRSEREVIMEACLKLMTECYNNDSNAIKLEFNIDDYIVECSFDYSIYAEE